MSISPIMHIKKPRRSPLRLRFLLYILEEISCASRIGYFPTVPKATKYEDMEYKISKVIAELYEQNHYLLEGNLLSKKERDYYESVFQ